MRNVQEEGWLRKITMEFIENDLVEITCAIKNYHEDLIERGKDNADYEWPDVRRTLRGIIEKIYVARGTEDNDPVSE